MNFVFQVAIENAVLVALAAPLVWAVSRLVRRPALTHALWLILLIKLVAPPVYRPAIPLPQRAVPNVESSFVAGDSVATMTAPSVVRPGSPTTEAPAVRPIPEFGTDPGKTSPPPSGSVHDPGAFIPALEIIWIVGSFVCLSIALARIFLFSRSLRHARPGPPELQCRVALLSRRLGLRTAPAVHFIPGSLCPMLWAVGRSPRLLIPTALWGRLDPGERDTIILHELAHWRRRDHWVRWVELAATTVYWWNPVCWWARRELREAEEQCCDAWVLHATGDYKPYANALFRAVEFISVPADSSPQHKPLPVLASGMGQFNHLKRRIIMLKNASVARALSPRTLAAAVGFSAVLLPLSPSLNGQAQTPPEVPVHTRVKVQAAGVKDVPVATNVLMPVEIELGVDDSASPEDQLKAARKEIQDLRQRLAQAEARLAVYKARDQGTNPNNADPLRPPPVNNNWNTNGQPGTNRAAAEAHHDPLFWSDPGVHDGKYRVVITDAATGRIKEIRELPLTPAADPARQAERLDKLEAQLRDLLRELQTIRQQSTPPESRELPARK